MASNKPITSLFDYGNTIVVKIHAPSNYRSGLHGCICGIRTIDSIEVSKQFNQNIDAELYLIEFEDGVSLEIPKEYLTLCDKP